MTCAPQFTSVSVSATFTTTGPAGTPVGWMFREDLFSPVRDFMLRCLYAIPRSEVRHDGLS